MHHLTVDPVRAVSSLVSAFAASLVAAALTGAAVAATGAPGLPGADAAPSAGADAVPTATATRFTTDSLSLSPGALMQSESLSGAPTAPPLEPVPAARRFGEAGMITFNIFGDFATDLDNAWMAGGQFGISWFFMDNLSLDVQLEQYGISQDGSGAYAIGPAMLFRWHFLAQETWSLYADLGCGVIYATNPVPSDGSRFNFTPRLGVGASIGLSESARVLTGVRWFHISNANTSTPNPGRDSAELYAGLSFAF